MKLVIIKYNAGNIQSVSFALERLGVDFTITDQAEAIQQADKVIFPGVGEASTTMKYLHDKKLDAVIRSLRQPVLGICLGMQLMCSYSEENDTDCLGIFEEKVCRFQQTEKTETALKIPQIGWNNIYDLRSPLFKDIPENSYCYFVHSYYAASGDHTIATADYIQSYSAGLHRQNFYGVQFHPEKSAAVGEQILKNFLIL